MSQRFPWTCTFMILLVAQAAVRAPWQPRAIGGAVLLLIAAGVPLATWEWWRGRSE